MADDIDAEAARLAELGAARHRRQQWWQVMTSPGGLPFCLCGDPDRRRPGLTNLLVQRLEADDPGTSTRAHVDIGTDDIDAEVARLEGLGARLRERIDRWVVLEDPAGLPFCVGPLPPD